MTTQTLGLLALGLALGWAVLSRIPAHVLDHRRIQQHLAARGGRVTRIRWTPLGPGGGGERDARLYTVYYLDRQGVPRSTTCKTSLLSGVYWTGGGGVRAGRVAKGDRHARELRCAR